MNRFSEWAANEYRDQGVTVMALCPGFTKTEFHERMGVRRGTGFMWLDVDSWSRRRSPTSTRARVYSDPGRAYRPCRSLTRADPPPGPAAFQSIGRK